MVTFTFEDSFKKLVKKIKKSPDLSKVKKQIRKIVENPRIGKPMRYGRRGTRELYVKPFRISYVYYESDEKVVFLDIYHKDKQ